ncbi:hypothetical protein SLS54_009843 [Diplodia seriata]
MFLQHNYKDRLGQDSRPRIEDEDVREERVPVGGARLLRENVPLLCLRHAVREAHPLPDAVGDVYVAQIAVRHAVDPDAADLAKHVGEERVKRPGPARVPLDDAARRLVALADELLQPELPLAVADDLEEDAVDAAAALDYLVGVLATQEP